MVLLSGKRKLNPIQQQIKHKLLIPYLSNQHETVKENISTMKPVSDPFYAQLVKVFETVNTDKTSDLSYQFKTLIQIEPEYEMYHLLFKTKIYDMDKLEIIRDCLSKKYTITKIKSMFPICPN
jgi:hypothetical protein